MAKFSSSHRDLHSSVSKVGKAVDRHFAADYDSTSREEVFAGKEQQRRLNEVVLQHFYRQGQLNLSDVLAEEAGLGNIKLSKEPFQVRNEGALYIIILSQRLRFKIRVKFLKGHSTDDDH